MDRKFCLSVSVNRIIPSVVDFFIFIRIVLKVFFHMRVRRVVTLTICFCVVLVAAVVTACMLLSGFCLFLYKERSFSLDDIVVLLIISCSSVFNNCS